MAAMTRGNKLRDGGLGYVWRGGVNLMGNILVVQLANCALNPGADHGKG